MDYQTLANLRREHPGWRLLTAANAPMIVSFLHRCFIAPNLRTLAQQELASRLEDYLYALRRQIGDDAFPRPALHYLDDWASDGSGWLRKFYPAGSDEPHYDITPATERAVDWLAGLQRRQFVGTESRLMTVFALLREMTEGTETDPLTRIADLEKRKAAIEEEIRRIRDGHLELMDATAVRDRFQQMAGTARSLLGDFREVEQNFRDLDRAVRERIATWDGAKGALLAEIFGERDAIADSDQGRSFRAFWDFLMSPTRQEELSALFDAVFALDPVKGLAPDPRLLRIHFDWLAAGEVTQRTVARLSEQLRRYLDDQAWLENRRIMQILHGIEQQALEVRDTPPAGPFMELDDPAPEIRLPMERTLFAPPQKPRIADRDLAAGDADVPADALFGQVTVDRARLAAQVRRALQTRDQVSLADLVEAHPLERGLAELVAYLSLAADDSAALIDDGRTQTLSWTDPAGSRRRATLPLVIFSRAGRPAGSAAP